MKALVTGANGFTGSHLVKALIQRGATIVAYVRPSSQLDRLSELPITYAYGDITDRAALSSAMVGVDTVFHTAAYVELGLVDAAAMERVNFQGTQAVLAAAKDAQVSKMVYCSTIGVFGDTQGQVVDETFQRTQTNFSSAYDRTKYLAQRAVDAAAKQGLDVVSVLPSGIFGSDDPQLARARLVELQQEDAAVIAEKQSRRQHTRLGADTAGWNTPKDNGRAGR
ncbi:MAG: NAD-dependent epimerase/dehydratase family protein, partial [Acaryochloridaceae cyanobacterium RU_4_10]|nr:NAD-dependent epimerase/dehydratase family protein [Acaryochloridaceae cyanobacterium RU_4_10]